MIFTALSGVCLGLAAGVAFVTGTRWGALPSFMRQTSIVTVAAYVWLASVIQLLGML
jgi:hypothetical protein